MQMESPGTKCWPGRDVGCCPALKIPRNSSAFWERAKMQMEFPGKKCRPGSDVGSSAFWEADQNADGASRDEMSVGKRCGLLSHFIDTT